MYTNVELPDHVRDAIVAASDGRPVRVLNGSGSNFVPPGWDGMIRAAGGTRARCESDGITLVSWGTDGQVPGLHEVVGWPDAPAYYGQHVRISGAPSEIVSVGSTPLAKVGDRVVYFAAPLNSLPEPRIREAISDALSRAADYEAAVARDREERERQAREQASRDFAQTLAGGVNDRVRNLESEVSEFERQIQNRARQIDSLYTQRNAKSQELRALRAGGVDAEVDRYMAMYDQIANHPRVQRVEVAGTRISIFTDLLTLHDPRDEDRNVPLGEFKIVMNYSDQYGLECHNLTNRREGWDHPHGSNGSICFGGHESLIYQLKGNHEYVALLEVLFQSLETYNPEDSYGAHAEYWFRDGEDDPEYEPEEDYEPEPVAAPTTATPTPSVAGECDCYACREARGQR